MTKAFSSFWALAASVVCPLDGNSKPCRLSCREPLCRVLLACLLCSLCSQLLVGQSFVKGRERSGRWCGITETTEVGYKLPVTQTVIAWQIIPEKIVIEPYAEPADNIGEGV